MRVCVLANTVFLTDPRVLRETECIAERCHQVDVLCLRKPNEPRFEIIKNIHIHRILRHSKPQKSWGILFQLSLFFLISFIWTSWLYWRKRYEVIHVHTIPDFEIFAAVIPKFCGARLVLDMHESMPDLYMRKFSKSNDHWMIRIIRRIEKLSFRFADHVILATPFMRDNLVAGGMEAEKCTAIINLPDLKYFGINGNINLSKNGKFDLIYHGTLSEVHGVDIAIQALKLISQETSLPIRFHIYGSGANKESLQALVQDLNLQDVVFFHQSVPINDLAKILREMDAGIVPKRDGVFAAEAISTKLFELAAMELPAIVSRTRGDSLFFDDSMVLFFEPGNDRQLADCILKLYRNPQLRRSLPNKAKAVTRRLNWQAQKRDLFKVYEDLINGKLHPNKFGEGLIWS